MRNFKPSLLTLALATTGLMSYQSVAAENDGANTEVEEVIQVRGIRGSLMRAQAVKMDSTSVVEVISAEDIGKLPDSSIAESLSRLPGLAGERRNGRTSGISVRGFKEDYVGTTLNGREVLGIGDNRGVEYDLYPSEIMNGVVVHKTSEATLTTQGIGGTVDLQTVRPLASDEYYAINANFEQNGMKSANPDFDDKGHRIAASMSKKFLDDTLGFALAIASTESPSQEEQFRGWGYADVATTSEDEDGNIIDHIYDAINNPNGPLVLASGLTRADVEGAKILGGHDSYVRSAMLERDTISAVLQYAPSADFKVTLDALYIDFTDSQIKRGLEEGGAEWGVGKNYTISSVENGLVTSGVFGDSNNAFRSVIRNDAYEKKAELNAFAANFEYFLNDDWKATLDLSTSKSEKTITDIESYSGVGRSNHVNQGAGAIRSFEMTPTGVMYSDVNVADYTDESLMKLAGPQAWGGDLQVFSDEIGTSATNAANGEFNYNHAQDGFINKPVFEEELNTFRFDVEGFLELGVINKVTAGVNYTDRTKSKVNTGAYLTVNNSDLFSQGAIPSDYIVGNTNLNFIGIGDFIAYDSLALYKDGGYVEWDAALAQTARLGDSYEVAEDVTQAYVKFDLETDIGDIFVKGNFGVQYVKTNQSSNGFYSTKDSDASVLANTTSGEDSYDHVLPSLTLNFELTDNQVVITSLSKTLSRARIDDLRASGAITFDGTSGRIDSTDVENSPWSANGGNPNLKPLEANQFDLNYSWYFADDGFFSAAFFYKDLVNWHRDTSLLVDFSDGYIPEVHQYLGEAPKIFEGYQDTKEDGLEGFVRGYEVQANLPLHNIADVLDGFGIVASASFTDGSLDDGSRVPGLSEESYQLTAYYENNGFEFRISGRKRDEFMTETRGLSLALEETENRGEELWDAQIGYDFGKGGFDSLDGLSISLQAQNLTDEDTLQAEASDPRQVTKYQSFGANYLFGVNYKF